MSRYNAQASRIDLNELDSLMEELAAPAPPQTASRVSPASHHATDNLDSLLDSYLPTKSHDYSTASAIRSEPASSYTYTPTSAPSKPSAFANTHFLTSLDCGHCGRECDGERLEALGKAWHLDHFQCMSCSRQIGTSNYYEVNGRPKCQTCYTNTCDSCAKCGAPITDLSVSALNRKWHKEHFSCVNCSTILESTFHDKGGQPYCSSCYYDKFVPKCCACNQPIRSQLINALNKSWHHEHFTCTKCGREIGSGSFYEVGGRPQCEHCYR